MRVRIGKRQLDQLRSSAPGLEIRGLTEIPVAAGWTPTQPERDIGA